LGRLTETPWEALPLRPWLALEPRRTIHMRETPPPRRAGFSPAGICTFPLSVYPGANKTAPSYIDGTNKSAAHTPQPSPWSWADYKGSPSPKCPPPPPRYACVKNGTDAGNNSLSYCVNVNNGSALWPYFIPGPFPFYPANCYGACKPLPPGWSQRLGIESLWSQLIRTCQRL
jgi:hypothetical protein